MGKQSRKACVLQGRLCKPRADPVTRGDSERRLALGRAAARREIIPYLHIHCCNTKRSPLKGRQGKCELREGRKLPQA